MEIIIGKQGTQRLSITEPTVSRRHCRVTPNGDGTYTIENLSQNGTKVDGVDIIRTTVRPNSRIQLGPRFSATLAELIGSGGVTESTISVGHTSSQKEMLSQSSVNVKSEPKTFNISHLRRVWTDFNQGNIEMAKKQQKVNLVRTGFGIFTMCATPTIFLLGPVGYLFTGIGILGNIYSFVGMKNAESIEDRQLRQDAFDEAWICPNPDCGRTLPAKNYKLLVHNYQSCPYCKCKYVEK